MSSFVGSGPLDLLWAAYVIVGTVLLVGWGIRVLRRLADRHASDDARAGTKATLGIVLGLVLGIGGVLAVAHFESSAEDGIHKSFASGPGGLNVTIGEADYLNAQKTIVSKTNAIGIQSGKLQEANATLERDASTRGARDALWGTLNTTKKERSDAEKQVKLLTPNHQLWLKVKPLVAEGKDEEAREVLGKALSASTVTEVLPADVACARSATTGDCLTPLKPAAITHVYKDTHQVEIPVAEGIPLAYETQEAALKQMATQLRFLVYPGLTGLFLAPMVVAGGSILRAAFVPSDTVGFKPYPSKAAATFLALGAFGVFCIPYGAWVLADLRGRSKEGQIAL